MKRLALPAAAALALALAACQGGGFGGSGGGGLEPPVNGNQPMGGQGGAMYPGQPTPMTSSTPSPLTGRRQFVPVRGSAVGLGLPGSQRLHVRPAIQSSACDADAGPGKTRRKGNADAVTDALADAATRRRLGIADAFADSRRRIRQHPARGASQERARDGEPRPESDLDDVAAGAAASFRHDAVARKAARFSSSRFPNPRSPDRGFALQLFHQMNVKGKIVNTFIASSNKSTVEDATLRFDFTLPTITVVKNEIWLLVLYGDELPQGQPRAVAVAVDLAGSERRSVVLSLGRTII